MLCIINYKNYSVDFIYNCQPAASPFGPTRQNLNLSAVYLITEKVDFAYLTSKNINVEVINAV